VSRAALAHALDAFDVDTESLEIARLRGVLYTRVSNDKSGRARSPQEQHDEGVRAFERHDIDLVASLQDLVGASEHTSSTKSRDGFAALRQMIERSEVDVVGAYSVDRVTRDDIEWPTLARLCKRHDVILLVDGRMYDLDNPEDAYHLDSEQARAKYEVAKLRKRVLRALRANADSGLPHGRAAFGYRHVYDRRGRLVGSEIDPARAAVVREIYARLEAGEALREIGHDFDARGVQAPSKCADDCDLDHVRHYDGTWGQNAPSRLRKIALNRTYVGDRVYRGEVVGLGCWEPIIEREQAERVRAILRDPTRKARGLSSGTRVKHLGSGIVTCAVCGGDVRPSTNRSGRKTPTEQYRCRWHGCVSRGRSLVNAAIERLVVGWLSSVDVAGAWNTAADATRLRAATLSLAELQAQLDDAESAWHAKELSARAFGGLESRLVPQIEDLQSQIARLRTPVPSEVVAMAGDQAQARWNAATIEQRRAVVRAVVPTMRLVRTADRRSHGANLVGIEFAFRGSDEIHMI
jgi:site-specific DNA recombinase